mgnify:CR=1 FL=1
MVPVLTTNVATSGTTNKADTTDDETNNTGDLDDGEDEFSLTVTSNPEQVDGNNDYPEQSNKAVSVFLLGTPVVNSDGGSNNFQGQNNKPLQGVVEVSSETKGLVNESGTVGGETTGDGKLNGQFTKGTDHTQDE